MQKQQPERATSARTERHVGSPGIACGAARRAIDCGGAADDRVAHPPRTARPERGDPHALLTSLGGYREQLQAI